MINFDIRRFCTHYFWRNICAISIIAIVFPPAGVLPASATQAEPVLDQRTQGITGRIIAWRTGKVSTQVPGLVKTLQVRVGQRVKHGDTLAILDTSQLERDLAVVQSELEVARAELGVAMTEQALKQNIFDRQKKLKQSAAFQIARYDEALLNLKIATANRSRAAAEVASRQANSKRKELDIKLSTIRAPYGGVILLIAAQAGSYITAEVPHLLHMVDDTSLEIEVDVPVQQLGAFQPGRNYSFRAEGQNRGQARIRAILPEVNRRTQTRPVRLTPLEKSSVSMLAPGQYVTILWREP